VQTLTIEAMVQDRKAIQAGTSHFLGQNFARASGIQFQNRDGKQEFGWTTSWGLTTRLVGTVVMMHSDDDGAILPPRIAPTQIVIIPVTPKSASRARGVEACDKLAARLRETATRRLLSKRRSIAAISAAAQELGWIKKGVPLRVKLARAIWKNSVEVSRRDQPVRTKKSRSD
jgi:prolyl-tRNA synthetase